jgi:hypothetical protein
MNYGGNGRLTRVTNPVLTWSEVALLIVLFVVIVAGGIVALSLLTGAVVQIVLDACRRLLRNRGRSREK